MAHAEHWYKARSGTMGELTDRKSHPRHHALETLRFALCGAIVGIAVYGIFTQDSPDNLPPQLVAAAIGFAVVAALRFVRII